MSYPISDIHDPIRSHVILCNTCGYENGIYRTNCFRCNNILSHVKPSDIQYYNTNRTLITDPVQQPLYRTPIDVRHSLKHQPISGVQSLPVTPTHQQYNIHQQPTDIQPVVTASTHIPIRTPTHNRVYYDSSHTNYSNMAACRPTSTVAYTDRGRRRTFDYNTAVSQQVNHIKNTANGLGYVDPYDIRQSYRSKYYSNEPVFPYKQQEQSETHVDEHKYEKYNKRYGSYAAQVRSQEPVPTTYTSPQQHTYNQQQLAQADNISSPTTSTATQQQQPQQQDDVSHISVGAVKNSELPSESTMYHRSLQATPYKDKSTVSPSQPTQTTQPQYAAAQVSQPTTTTTTTTASSSAAAAAEPVTHTPSKYELEPYGRDLAEKTATFLLQRGGIYYKRYSGWSTGLFYNRLYGWLYMVLYNGVIQYNLQDRVIYQTYNEHEFKCWLAEQSDYTLSGHELGKEFFKKGRVNRELLYSAIYANQFYPIH